MSQDDKVESDICNCSCHLKKEQARHVCCYPRRYCDIRAKLGSLHEGHCPKNPKKNK